MLKNIKNPAFFVRGGRLKHMSITSKPWKADKNLGCKSIKGGKVGNWKQTQYKHIAYTVGLSNKKEDLANAL
jgi:hypothetical protein